MGEHRVERVRHDTCRRTLIVHSIVRLTQHMVRIGFTSNDLAGFTSPSFDDHIKLFFPAEDNGAEQMRDYTPRRFDVAAGRVTIDFAVHDAGIATAWALAARLNDRLQIGGPRGSAIIPADFERYWLVGDETALPAIGRWIEDASAGAAITTFVVVEDFADRQRLRSEAEWVGVWPVRADGSNDAELLATPWPCTIFLRATASSGSRPKQASRARCALISSIGTTRASGSRLAAIGSGERPTPTTSWTTSVLQGRG